MRAANMDEIEIMGAVFVRISGADVSGKIYTAPIMAYVSPSTEKFYLSRESLVQLGVIPEKFPMVGAAVNSFLPMNTCAIEGYNAPWNGFHSVRLAKEDRHLTTFITPWGRHQYKVAPQGSLASGDGYSRRYDEIIADVERKTKCVDDTAMWDDDLETHWWRVIDFLELCGRNGVILNFDKFQFSQ